MSALKFFFQKTSVIAWRDFYQTGFKSPLFFSMTGLFCVFFSYIFPRELFQFASSYMMPAFGRAMGEEGRNIHFAVFVSHVSLVNLALLFCVPALAGVFLAEEKKTRSFDLLMTAPVSSLNIVIGKYAALFGLVVCFILVTLFYPLMTALFSVEIPFGPLLSSYIGLVLLAALYSAAALFASALTSSVVLTYIIGVILNIMLWFISQGSDFSDNPVFKAVMEYMSLGSHLTLFIQGSLTINSFVFFASATVFFLFLVYRVIEFARWRP